MKKYISAILALALILCLLVTGCSKNNVESGSTDTVPVTNDQNIETQNHHSEIEPSKNQVRTGNYVCEYGDYIFYRNTNDNGSIYRYNIKDDSYVRLFNQNYNANSSSFCIYGDYLYFTTQTKTDNSSTLYRISINGGEAERLIENMWLDFVVTENAIYYTCEKKLCKYTFSDKKSITFPYSCDSFNLIDDKIYCLIPNTGRGSSLAYFDISTETVTRISTGEMNSFLNATSANNGKIIYLDSGIALYSYNIENGEFKLAANNFVIYYMSVADDNLVYFSTRPFEGGAYKLYQYKDGTLSEYTDTKFEDFQAVEVINNKPIMINTSTVGPDKIIGDERLNVVVDGVETDIIPSVDTNIDPKVMINYYGFTMNDVIKLWGDDYVLNDYLYSGGWAGIYYEDNRCPFTFYYRADDIPTVCDANEKLIGIGVNRFANVSDYFIIEDITITTSYEVISKQLTGDYYPNELTGGNTFKCVSIEKTEDLLITWPEGKSIPSRVEIKFDYN